jgi:hypothetical protein
VKLPELEALVVQDVVQDDSVDDFLPEPSMPSQATPEVPIMTTATSAPQLVIPDDLNVRLTSIDSSLARIATAVELLVDHLTRKVDPSQS